ncbi:potassium channel family protein [Oceanotoga teriensis]|jgi:voltage-gated potassium channel|uniref:Voltage-gated potassium channel n=1 Tax=Oceanotoga teriensis TaxID=515440 RepID=A0AA45C933_9BACT|nr:potassium channel protein [Oceanotoga teriensis]MDO7977181.1 potassium channel protein [Oceanotoga teriensis]PWJ96548.1 voltage-gated potassium channel [Oceanotoga teriensis]
MKNYYLRLRRIIVSFIVIIFIIIIGTAGYMALEKWTFIDSLFFTLVTLSTVGYSIPDDLSFVSQYFTIFLILSGMTFVIYSLSQITSFIIEGEIKNLLEVRKRMKQISNMNNHFIVVGAGKTGFYVCETLKKSNKDFVLIDKNEENVNKIINNFNSDFPFIIGDIKDEDVFINAGIKKAGTIILTLPSDIDNLFVILTVKTINENIKIISKANEPESLKKLKYAGVDKVVLESEITGNRLGYLSIRPNIVTFLETITRTEDKELRLEEVKIPQESWMVNKTLKEISLPNLVDLIVISIKKYYDEDIFNPKADSLIEANDRIIVLGEEEKVQNLRKIVKGDYK